MGPFELSCLIQSLPHGLHDQTDQRIGRSIRKKRPIQRNAKMEMKTSKYNWASKFYESQNRVGRGHRWRCGCEGINCPAARYEKARTRPHSNPIFHAAAPTVLWFNGLTNSSELQTNTAEILLALQLLITCPPVRTAKPHSPEEQSRKCWCSRLRRMCVAKQSTECVRVRKQSIAREFEADN